MAAVIRNAGTTRSWPMPTPVERIILVIAAIATIADAVRGILT